MVILGLLNGFQTRLLLFQVKDEWDKYTYAVQVLPSLYNEKMMYQYFPQNLKVPGQDVKIC